MKTFKLRCSEANLKRAHENFTFTLQDCAWGKKDIDKNQMPNTAKLLRLAFHDCAPYLAEDGSTYGGINGGGPTEKRSQQLYVICCVQDVTAASTGKEWDLDTQDSPEAQTTLSRIIIQRTS